jgi:hypothetical protein
LFESPATYFGKFQVGVHWHIDALKFPMCFEFGEKSSQVIEVSFGFGGG